jgi:hypothetical protein
LEKFGHSVKIKYISKIILPELIKSSMAKLIDVR